MTVKSRVPLGMNGAGTGGSAFSAPVGSVCRPAPLGTGVPSMARSTFELGVKPEALISTPSACGAAAVPAVT